MTGLLQQKLTNQVVNGVQLKDQNWNPAAGGDTLNLIDGEICDEVGSMADTVAFDALPEGSDFFSATQEFRILYSTPCTTDPPSPPLEMYLGSWSFKKKKKSDTQWWIE
ncbi:hypothetical protein [Singulisphaera acidiphila]|uniref:Uncharacterized protein n=1 Tax=Singulisphaera acidiphila (strain ATCC BAA-1392 / DSM 18658 / VKM B-2454 / MOB10) TaxID=886293 RepID=L0DSY6_SINAD|nr:hypothetical protein [Singulisphaera acidiphila]AGA31476.1 hypothetical protein Sinac_7439 [Singulisphaera acidiphila DSM 18658]